MRRQVATRDLNSKIRDGDNAKTLVDSSTFTNLWLPKAARIAGHCAGIATAQTAISIKPRFPALGGAFRSNVGEKLEAARSEPGCTADETEGATLELAIALVLLFPFERTTIIVDATAAHASAIGSFEPTELAATAGSKPSRPPFPPPPPPPLRS